MILIVQPERDIWDRGRSDSERGSPVCTIIFALYWWGGKRSRLMQSATMYSAEYVVRLRRVGQLPELN